MDKLVQENSPLVWAIARRLRYAAHELDDLYQIGAIGLVKAIRRFDPAQNVAFSTYAVPLIMGEIKAFMRDDGMIKISRNLKQLAAKAARHLKEENAGIEKTAQTLNVTVEELVMALEACAPVTSINTPLHEGGDATLMDTLKAKGVFEDTLADCLSLHSALQSLPKRETTLIYFRFYRGMTQSQTAARLGISQVQVSRLEKKILGVLKQDMMGTG